MEIVRISEEKLKLTLCKEELEKYDLKPEELDYDKTETRRVIWQILDEAKRKTGFDAASDRALIEAYPGRRGGCEIYVTLLSEKKKSKGVRGRIGIYRFTDAEHLFSLAAAMKAGGREYESALYRMDDGGLFLVLKEPLEESIRKETVLSPLSFVEEYGARCKQGGLFHALQERGECLIQRDAISRLSPWKRQE
ncbi:MAG: adaptor protein MecA [Clostridia bacterium]|nr:adaptor protein MecA [Clostridia bacterium]